jgi:hypothetical protein
MAANKASPMPMGAMKVSCDFSAASMSTTNTRRDVKNISMNNPCEMDVPPPKTEFARAMLTGNMAETRPPAQREAISCTGKKMTPRSQGSCPDRQSPTVIYKNISIAAFRL